MVAKHLPPLGSKTQAVDIVMEPSAERGRAQTSQEGVTCWRVDSESESADFNSVQIRVLGYW